MRELVKFLSQWRVLHQGVYVKQDDGERRLQKFELKECARLIGISNKTLDDYQLQVQIGLANGFDFLEHQDKKVGFLRHFNVNKSHKSA